MKKTNCLLIALICFGIILAFYIFNYKIIAHPYIKYLIFILFAVGGYFGGVGISKTIKGED